MENTLLKEKIDLPAWIKNCNNITAPNSLFALSKTNNSLFKFLETHSLEEISFCLGQLDIKNINPYHTVNVLRSLYSIRKGLSNWDNIEKNVRSELEYRGLDVNIMLGGLNED